MYTSNTGSKTEQVSHLFLENELVCQLADQIRGSGFPHRYTETDMMWLEPEVVLERLRETAPPQSSDEEQDPSDSEELDRAYSDRSPSPEATRSRTKSLRREKRTGNFKGRSRTKRKRRG